MRKIAAKALFHRSHSAFPDLDSISRAGCELAGVVDGVMSNRAERIGSDRASNLFECDVEQRAAIGES
jgi:hypothetical protein